MFEALNEFIAIVADAAPWLLPFVVLLVWWGFTNWQVLNSPEKKESFAWAITQLKENNWGKRYLYSLGWLLNKINNWVGDYKSSIHSPLVLNASKGFILRFFDSNPFTSESYEKCLRLSLLYPFISFFIAWGFGSDGSVGAVDWLNKIPLHPDQLDRLLLIVGLATGGGVNYWLISYSQGQTKLLIIMLLLVFYGWIGSIVNHTSLGLNVGIVFGVFLILFLTLRSILSLAISKKNKKWRGLYYRGRIYNACYVVSFYFSLIGIFSDIVDIGILFIIISLLITLAAGEIALGYIFAAAFLFLFYGVVGVGVLAIAPLFIGMVIVFFNFIQKTIKHSLFIVVYNGLLFFIGYAGLYYVDNSSHMILLLFWLLFPLVNAPLDWLSLGVTRGLLQSIYSGYHGGWSALGFGLLDLLLAVLFLFLITSVLVGVLALGNVLTEKTLVDLQTIFAELKTDPSSINYWWIYSMMLSTLVPTLVHFALVGGAMTLWLPQSLRVQIADNIGQNHYKISAAWVYLTFTPAVGFVIAPVLLMLLLYWLVTTNGGWLGGHLLDWAEWLAFTINPTTGTQP